MARFCKFLPLLLSLTLAGAGQTSPTGDNQAASAVKPDAAAALLEKVISKYSQAQYYHIESIAETDMTGELSRDWNRELLTSAMAPGNRYRLEAHNQMGTSLKVSDGKTEVIYNADYHEYTRQPAPEHGPSPMKGPIYQDQFGMMSASNLVKDLITAAKSIVSPALLPDESILAGGEQVLCYVIKGRNRNRGGPGNVVSSVTLWIDKKTLAIRKSYVRQEGAIIMNHPQHMVEDRTTIYPVAELDPPSFKETLFAFQPAAGDQMVREFSDPRHPRDLLAGKPAPEVALQSGDGKGAAGVALKQFRGKPVLLDFWATWCEPCVASLDQLKKLQSDMAPRGLVVLSVDEDDDAATSRDFWLKHDVKWPNFHDEGEIAGSFPSSGGVPFFVLIDAGGTIVYSHVGANDAELRAAIAKLGPEFAGGEGKK